MAAALQNYYRSHDEASKIRAEKYRSKQAKGEDPDTEAEVRR